MPAQPSAFAPFHASAVVLVLLSGCASSSAPAATAPAQEVPAAAADSGVETVQRSAQWTAGANAGGVPANFVGSGNPIEHVSGENLTGLVVEMAWDATTPMSGSMTLTVGKDGQAVGSASGPSPLRLAFPGGDVHGDLVLYGDADSSGAYASQEVTFYVTSFRGVPFDAAYSAVPA
jgi:hypothetical protein